MKIMGRSMSSIAWQLASRFASPAKQSYSGAGEDRFVLAWLQVVYGLSDASKIRYCDIGANHPTTRSPSIAEVPAGFWSNLIQINACCCVRIGRETQF
jgi:hypothetical protein